MEHKTAELTKLIEGLYKQTSAIKDVSKENIFEEVHPINANNFTVFGVHKAAADITARAFHKNEIETTTLQDSQGNKYFIIANQQKELAIDTLQYVKNGIKNYLPISEPELMKISKGRKTGISELNNIPDFYFHSLKTTLPIYQIPFRADSIRPNTNVISFLEEDKAKVEDCIKAVADFMKSPVGKKEARNFFIADLTLKEAVNRLKNNEEIIIAFKGDNTSMKLSQDKTTITLAGKDTNLEGDVFSNNVFNNIAYQIVSRPDAVVLSKEEFNSDRKEEIIKQKINEMANSISSTFLAPRAIDEQLDDVMSSLNNLDTHRGFEPEPVFISDKPLRADDLE